MEQDILTKIQAHEVKLDAIIQSVEKTRKYMLISVWITVIMMVLPLIIGAIVIPIAINSYLSSFEGLI